MCYAKTMKVTFDVEKLNKLMSDFYNCMKITITLFDSELNYITGAGDMQPYCDAIRTTQTLWERCHCSDRDNALTSKGLRTTYVYTCHAGIVESVTPIFYDETLIAYLMLGKFRDAEEKYSSTATVCEVAKKYGLNDAEMLARYNQLPLFTKSYIDSAISILEACICFIGSENYIHLHRSALASKIENYVEENLSRNITVAELSKQFHVSRQILYSIFKLEFNDTIRNFILKKRLQRAQYLLTTTQKPISDIATSVGFIDYNYFIRFFKKRLGVSPLQYRKSTNA